jgi:hypothetical protein
VNAKLKASCERYATVQYDLVVQTAQHAEELRNQSGKSGKIVHVILGPQNEPITIRAVTSAKLADDNRLITAERRAADTARLTDFALSLEKRKRK